MKVISMTLKNWMNIESADLSFDDGINVLYGQNGQGKSAVLSAIAFMLLDKTRESSYKHFIQIGKGSFEIGMVLDKGTNDLMKFSFVGSSTGCSKDVEYQGTHYLNSDASTFLSTQFDKDMLENVIFLLQDSRPITSMTPAERRDIFKKIFNSDYSSIVEKVKADQKVVDQKITQHSTEKDLLLGKKYNVFRILDVDMEELEALRKELEESQSSELDKEKFRAYSDKLKDLNTRQQELAKAISGKEDILTSLSASKSSLASILVSCGELEAKSVTLKEEADRIRGELELLKASNKEYADSVDIPALEAEKEARTKELVEFRATLQINTKYLETHRMGVCDSCGQSCDPKNIVVYENLIQEFKNKCSAAGGEIFRLNEEIKTYNEKVKANDLLAKAKEADEAGKKTELERVRAQIATKESMKEMELREQASITKRVGEMDASISDISLKVTELEKWVKANTIEIKEGTSRSKQQIQDDINALTMQIQENAAHEKINAQSQVEKQADLAKVAAISAGLNDLQIESKNLSAVVSVFTTDFPSFINMKACQVLEGYMNDFFGNTKKGFKVTLQQDKKGINFFYKAGKEPEWNSIKMTSGFEGSLLGLCFRVAVAYAYGSDFIVLDEPDGAGDPEHSNKLFETISSIGGFKQMFVITHKESAIELLKDNGALVYEVKNGTFRRMAA